MEKHRPWRRMASMFRRRRSDSNLQSTNQRRPGLRRVSDADTNNNLPPPPYILSRLFRDVYRSHNSPQRPSSHQPHALNHVINWSALIFTSSPYGRNLDRFRDFTPKCLSNINYEGLLHGQESYDNFSSSCWLEDHLHQFARVSDDIMSEIENEHESNEIVSATDENFTFMSLPNRLEINSSLPLAETVRSNASHGSNSLSVHSSSDAGSGGSTISDVTQFFNNMNLSPSRAAPNQPPPYSERSDEDPPPSYTEVFVPLREGRRQSNANVRASNTLFQDILW